MAQHQQQQYRNPIPDGQAAPNDQRNPPSSFFSANSTQRSCCGKISRCGKCCIGCSICSVVLAAIVVPIIIFVVAPDLAQYILDNTEIALPNMTQGACSGLHAYVINTAMIKVPGPLVGSATLHSYTQEVYTTVCGAGDNQQGGWACDNATEALVGKYMQPEMSLSQGSNTEDFAVRLDLNNSAIVFSGIIFPTFLYHHKARLILKAKDISISTLGLKIGGLHMHKEVTCSPVKQLPQQNLPNSACYPDDPKHQPDSASYYELSCVAGETNLTMSPAAPSQATMVSV